MSTRRSWSTIARVPRLTILAAGNGDLRDSLYALRDNGSVTWNGINGPLRQRHPRWSARVIHRTMTRSDATLAATGSVPAGLDSQTCLREPFDAASQFATDIFDIPADVVTLSIQADVTNALFRHRADGHLLYPYEVAGWTPEQRQWLHDAYKPMPMLEPAQAMHNLRCIINRLRSQRSVPILIFNMSSIMPWERVRCYCGLPETLSERIRRFNLALIDLSRATGVAIVDVDALLGSAGVERTKVGALFLNATACRLIAEEVVSILEDAGTLTGTEDA